MDSIRQWTADARNGDTAALTNLYEVTRRPLLQRIRLMMGRGPRRDLDSMDLLQDVQLRVLGSLDKFDGKGESNGLMCWMTTIARNRLCDLDRLNRTEALDSFSVLIAGIADEQGESPSVHLHKKETWAIVIEAMDGLAPNEREVIALHSLDGLSFPAVSKELSLSERTLRTLHARALLRIGSAIKKSNRIRPA